MHPRGPPDIALGSERVGGDHLRAIGHEEQARQQQRTAGDRQERRVVGIGARDKIGIEEITKSVTDISSLSQNNAAGAEEIASSAEQLAGMAETLKQKVSFFKV